DRRKLMSIDTDAPPPSSLLKFGLFPGFWIFLVYGANPRPGEPRTPFHRHALFVRITHWLNAGILTVMLMSGLQIFNATPALYWGMQSDFAHPILSFPAYQNADGEIVRGETKIGSWTFNTTGVLGASRVDGEMAARAFP